MVPPLNRGDTGADAEGVFFATGAASHCAGASSDAAGGPAGTRRGVDGIFFGAASRRGGKCRGRDGTATAAGGGPRATCAPRSCPNEATTAAAGAGAASGVTTGAGGATTASRGAGAADAPPSSRRANWSITTLS